MTVEAAVSLVTGAWPRRAWALDPLGGRGDLGAVDAMGELLGGGAEW